MVHARKNVQPGENISARQPAPETKFANPLRFAAMRERSMLLLLLLLVATVFITPALLPYGPIGRFVMDVQITFVLLTGLLAVAEHRRIVPILALLTILSIAVYWTEWFVASTLLPAVRDLSILLSMAVLAVAVGINVFGPGRAVANRIIGAVVLYLLIGLTWAVAYSILHAYSPSAFTGVEGMEPELERWTYFSFVTLTTVGYGDIAPLTRAARSLAIFEALVGQLYPAVILARLVSLPSDGRPHSGNPQL
jgi:ion channel